MTSFITKSACHGRRPSHLVGLSGRQRPHLVAHLLRERTVARFVVAPNGYGKTNIAVEYAETVFSWVHVFWINCQSPCFVRDLDEEGIADDCLGADGNAKLVVFDNVPALDHARSTMFSKAIDALLEASCEVVVTCAPTGDAYASLQRDRLLMSARDLLLNDEEVDLVRSADERAAKPAYDISPAQRVPALMWGDGPAVQGAFLKSAFDAEIPTDLALVMATMLVLRQGSLGELASFGMQDLDSMRDLLAAHPHLCIDFGAGHFETPLFEMGDLARAMRRRLGEFAARSPFADKGELVLAWADALMAPARSTGRACDVVRELCSVRERMAWIHRRAFELMRLGCFYGCYRLIDSTRQLLPKESVASQVSMAAIDVACLHMLGDESLALKRAKRFGFMTSSSLDAQIFCLLLLVRYGSGALHGNAIDSLRTVLEQKGAAPSQFSLAEWAAHAQFAALDGADALCAFWERQRDSGASPESLCLTASWALDARCALPTEDEDPEGSRPDVPIGSIERYVRDELERLDDVGANLFAAMAGLALERVHMLDPTAMVEPLPTSVLLGLRNVEMSLMSQRRMYERDRRAERLRQDSWAETHPSSLGLSRANQLAPAERRTIPILTVRLFGRFEASIGMESINPSLFKRQSVCTLLALLTLNRNRELMRDTLARSLWPKSTIELATKNFYTVWSQLRKALTLPDGTCPYLIRHQYGCSLNSRYVQSDVERFDEICHELLFGMPDPIEWPALYGEIQRDFSGELVPGDNTNALLISIRSECSVRLIDALLAASRGTVATGYPQWGIWYARAAIARDRIREDAYMALMRAQIAADQRTAAMMTFLKCQHVLSDELGIDPSPETVALYNTLLESM